ncbi:MAG: IS110 family transposase, partial [Candidatus Margulisbacteria bacterium]|nr:IS110 family transposase [Candidatus Margulisiibacteriota bacterium]
LNIRRRLAKERTKIILQAKSILRGLGIKLASGFLSSLKGFNTALFSLEISSFEKEIVEDLKQDFIAVTERINNTEKKVELILERVFLKNYKLLLTIPGIGFVTAATILSSLDNIERFERAGKLSAYFGLIPSEHSSGEKLFRGRITKEGVKEIRMLLVQAAWAVIRYAGRNKVKNSRTQALRKKYYKISLKEKNSQKAIIAIARHLSRIVFGVLRHQKPYINYLENVKPASI